MHIKKILLIVALFMSFGFYCKADLIQQADSAYLSDDYELASSLYLKAEKELGTSSSLYYNIGNSFYRMGDLGKAILYYKRALKLDPANGDARQNLQFVMSKTVDKQNANKSFADKIGERIMFSASPNAWAVWALVLFALLLGATAVYIFSGSVLIRKICFFGGIILLVMDCGIIYVANKTASMVADKATAVVVTPTVQLSTVPRVPKDKSEQAFQLHEGAVIEIIDSVKQTISDSIAPMWLEIKFDDVHRAWINSEDVERM